MADDADPIGALDLIPRLVKSLEKLGGQLEVDPRHGAVPARVLKSTCEFLTRAEQFITSAPEVVARAKNRSYFAAYTDIAAFATAMADDFAAGRRNAMTPQGALRQMAGALAAAVKEERHIAGEPEEKTIRKGPRLLM